MKWDPPASDPDAGGLGDLVDCAEELESMILRLNRLGLETNDTPRRLSAELNLIKRKIETYFDSFPEGG